MTKTGTRMTTPKREHEVAYKDLCNLLNRHADKVDALDLLAIAANMLGKLIAMQDQRRVTAAQAMEIVAANIEQGNKEVHDHLMQSEGSA